MSEFIFTTITGSLPQKLTTQSELVTEVRLYGFSGFVSGVGLSNNAIVHVGLESGKLPIQVPSGSSATFSIDSPDPSLKENLANFWIKATSGNGVYVIFD